MFWPSSRVVSLVSEEFSDSKGHRHGRNTLALYIYVIAVAIFGGYTASNWMLKGLGFQVYSGLLLVVANALGVLSHYHRWRYKPENHLWFLSLYSLQSLNVYFFGLGPYIVLPMMYGQLYVLKGPRTGLVISLPLVALSHWALLAHVNYSPSELEVRALLAITLAMVALHCCTAFCTHVLARLILSRRKAEELEQRKQFISLATHELRTPLAQVRQSLYASGLAKLAPDLFQRMDMGLEYLSWIVTRVVDFQATRDKMLKPRPTPLNPMDFFSELHREMVPYAEQKSLNFVVETSELANFPILLDWELLRKALRCLLENSIEHNTKHGFVKLVVYPETQFSLGVEISDSAGGLDKKNLKRIFKAFQSTQLADHADWRGLGLGLYMARQYVKCLGGELRLLQTGLSGSTFKLFLPWVLPDTGNWPSKQSKPRTFSSAHREQPDTVHPSASSPVGQAEPAGTPVQLKADTCVLVVDDSELILMSTVDVLQSQGLKVITAPSGEAALNMMSMLQTQHALPDLILMDLQMPGMDGFQTTQHLRALLGEFSPPIVAFTASTYTEFSEETRQAQFDGFFQKGDSVAKLLALLRGLSPLVDSTPLSAPTAQKAPTAALQAPPLAIAKPLPKTNGELKRCPKRRRVNKSAPRQFD